MIIISIEDYTTVSPTAIILCANGPIIYVYHTDGLYMYWIVPIHVCFANNGSTMVLHGGPDENVVSLRRNCVLTTVVTEQVVIY